MPAIDIDRLEAMNSSHIKSLPLDWKKQSAVPVVSTSWNMKYLHKYLQ